ncbi:MAG: DUF47 family protein [Ruminococcaceae bacterium]|nr:DUF47 family protein [Oscillospiraceae bacterium]
MASKKDNFFFNNFVECAEIASEASKLLYETLKNFDVAAIPEQLKKLHEIEHRGDLKKHEMTAELVRAFITPIEREDIMALSQNIDDVTDSIEDVLIHIHIDNVTAMREDVLAFAEIVVRCCDTMRTLLAELPNFKKSKRLGELVVELNNLEEEGDACYFQAMRNLHTQSTDPVEIIVWREIYEYLELCCDRCEHVADVVSGISIFNT